MAKRLGEILVEKNLVSGEQIEEALRIQAGGNRRLGYILVRRGVIGEEQLYDILKDHLDVPCLKATDLSATTAASVLPRFLCRKYTILPLHREASNTLSVAMVDPSDDAAIADIEAITGGVVRPCLARRSEISAAIGRHVPFSVKEMLNPHVYGRAARLATLCVLVLLVGVGLVAYRYVMQEKYGSVSVAGEVTTYKNHDLMVGVEQRSGKISLLGHGAFAEGFYTVSFPSVEGLKTFVEQKQKSFSEKQALWLSWLISQKLGVTANPPST